MSLVKEAFEKGSVKYVEEHMRQEKDKKGRLRGGSTGVLNPALGFVGKCPRLAYLRYKGINVEEANYSRELMFAGGRANEDLWVDVLSRGWRGPILCEEEIPTYWETKNGVAVTGRPDIVLCEEKRNVLKGIFQKQIIPKVGIELKLVSSLWTARDVLQAKPKPLHLMQAAHYMWQLDIPFELWYTNRTDLATTGWAQKLFDPTSPHIELGKDQKPKKVLPFIKGFELRFREGDERLQFREVGGEPEWTSSFFSRADIQNFFEYVSTMDEADELPPAPTNLDSTGEKMNWSFTDYCKLGDLCCGKCPITSRQEWFNKVKEKYS